MKSRKLSVVLILGFVLCAAITIVTIAEDHFWVDKPSAPVMDGPSSPVVNEPSCSEPGYLDLRDFELGVEPSVVDEDTFAVLASKANTVLQTYEEIVLRDSFVVEYYLRENDDVLGNTVTLEGDVLSIIVSDTPECRSHQLYIILLSLISEAYADSVLPIDYQYDWMTYNRGYIPLLILCTEYEDAGYDSITAYYEAFFGRECPPPANAFYIDFSKQFIASYSEYQNSLATDGNLSDINIYPSFIGNIPE